MSGGGEEPTCYICGTGSCGGKDPDHAVKGCLIRCHGQRGLQRLEDAAKLLSDRTAAGALQGAQGNEESRLDDVADASESSPQLASGADPAGAAESYLASSLLAPTDQARNTCKGIVQRAACDSNAGSQRYFHPGCVGHDPAKGKAMTRIRLAKASTGQGVTFSFAAEANRHLLCIDCHTTACGAAPTHDEGNSQYVSVA